MSQPDLPALLLRPAAAADAAALSRLAWAGKAYWGYPAEWMAAWRDALAVTPDYIAANVVLCGDEAVRTVACVAFQRAGDDLYLDHLWLDVPLIGTGRGRTLFQLAARHAAEHLGVTRFLIESEPNAEGFYLRMGCRRVGQVVSRLTGTDRVLPLLAYDVAANAASDARFDTHPSRH